MIQFYTYRNSNLAVNYDYLSCDRAKRSVMFLYTCSGKNINFLKLLTAIVLIAESAFLPTLMYESIVKLTNVHLR